MSDERPQKRLLTVEEAAYALGLGRSMVYHLMGTHELKSIRIGKARRIPIEAIDEYIAQGLQKESPLPQGE